MARSTPGTGRQYNNYLMVQNLSADSYKAAAAAFACSVGVITLPMTNPLLPIASSTGYVFAGAGMEVVFSPIQSAAAEFKELSQTWHRETDIHSLAEKKIYHHAYLDVIRLGQIVVPYILQEMQRRPADWTHALRAITKEDPAAGRSNLRDSIEAWIAWGVSKGYVQNGAHRP